MENILQPNHKIITCESQWMDVEEKFKNITWLGVDTEFMRERTYYPQLCLVQLSTDEINICLDVLEFDCSDILAKMLSNNAIIKIIHSASQDIEALGYYCKSEFNNLFDTQLAAEFVNIAPQVGYGTLVKELLDVDLPKSQTRSNWAKRPLTPQQIEYSLNDVKYLKPIADALEKQLINSHKKNWFEDEQQKELERMQNFQVDPQMAYLNFKSSHRLSIKNQYIVKRLVNWRERVAIDTNKPKVWVLSNKSIAEIGARLPQDRDSLLEITKLDYRFKKRYLEDIESCIQTVIENDMEIVWLPREQLSESQKQKVNELKRQFEKIALKLDLPVTRLATRKDIVDFVSQGAGRLTSGWRKEVFNRIGFNSTPFGA